MRLYSFRHLGLMFLAPGATYSGIPAAFAYPAAFGDLLAAVLAISAVPPDPSSGFLTSKAHWTCLWRSFSLRSMTHRRTADWEVSFADSNASASGLPAGIAGSVLDTERGCEHC